MLYDQFPFCRREIESFLNLTDIRPAIAAKEKPPFVA